MITMREWFKNLFTQDQLTSGFILTLISDQNSDNVFHLNFHSIGTKDEMKELEQKIKNIMAVKGAV